MPKLPNDQLYIPNVSGISVVYCTLVCLRWPGNHKRVRAGENEQQELVT